MGSYRETGSSSWSVAVIWMLCEVTVLTTGCYAPVTNYPATLEALAFKLTNGVWLQELFLFVSLIRDSVCH